MRGRVKWYNDVKGYGFIQQVDGEDVFVHYSVIEVDGFRALMEDQEVDYEYSEGPKGLQATRVVPV
ncbi:MAG: cold-shock protein [Candidatus Glassbacteria bacterium]|nr:cold-shock protein [Candidatus Glassbacteria bacterium]